MTRLKSEMKNDFHAFLRSRRSIRSFNTDPVPNEILQRILETTICAPSAHNLQPWRLVVVTNPRSKLYLAEAVAGKFRKDIITDGTPEQGIEAGVRKTIRRALDAPIIIVLCRDKTNVKPQPDAVREQAEGHMGVQSVAMAGLQLLLAAHAEGLGSTWICWPLFAPEETRHALELPSNWEPEGMIFLGYSDEIPEMPMRIPLQEVIRSL
jgi:coenzyme F420-0:L-glutamate ligase / coenzyme F420-1:gamma-L-glutamate ligase